MLTVTDLALNKLVPSPRNVRRTGNAHIDELAASIAAHGLLQNLTVTEARDGRGRKTYEVIAGGRRLAALKLLAKRKQVAANAPVPCHVISDEENVTELSLAENAMHEPMHPSDQFDAFYALSTEYGMSAEDIAARFGVTAAVVKQRLKLASISPQLIEAYRQDEMNLDQLTAFAITDEHAKQEKVWAALKEQDADRDELLSALTDAEVSASNPLARFVGQEAYVAAGGIVLHDLFDADSAYFADVDLLDDLAKAKFESVAENIRAEGWKWVAIMPRYDWAAASAMRRVYARPLPLSEADQDRFDALDAAHDSVLAQEESEVRDTGLARLEAAMDALRGKPVFALADLAMAGAIVTLTPIGELRIERGLVRPDDDPGKASQPRQRQEGPAPLSASLVGALTAQQTMALRDAVGSHGEAALIAVTHALAAALFLPHAEVSCLAIRANSRCLLNLCPGIADSTAGQRIAARHESWAQRLPVEPEGLWDFVAGLDTRERLRLLAHCVGLSIDATRHFESEPKAGVAELAAAVQLDLRADWQPTAANYFGRVSRDRILAAVREGVSPEAADNLAALKKAALAAEAERRLQGKGWLPPLLRLPEGSPPLAAE